jgi:hypothetical protein
VFVVGFVFHYPMQDIVEDYGFFYATNLGYLSVE